MYSLVGRKEGTTALVYIEGEKKKEKERETKDARSDLVRKENQRGFDSSERARRTIIRRGE